MRVGRMTVPVENSTSWRQLKIRILFVSKTELPSASRYRESVRACERIWSQREGKVPQRAEANLHKGSDVGRPAQPVSH